MFRSISLKIVIVITVLLTITFLAPLDEPHLAFDLNCIAVIEGQETAALLGGSNVGINDEHWEIGDYQRTYNAYLRSVNDVNNEAST